MQTVLRGEFPNLLGYDSCWRRLTLGLSSSPSRFPWLFITSPQFSFAIYNG
ncbi:hypothetical protein BgiBS90_017347, partial [Biomphalaria glabrata]